VTGTKKFKVAFVSHPISDGNSVRGVGYYTRNLMSALSTELAKNHEYSNIKIDFIYDSFNPDDYQLVHYPFFDPFSLTLPPKLHIPFIVTVHDLIPIEYRTHFPSGIKGGLKWLIQRHRLRHSDFLITVSHFQKYIISDLINYSADRIYVTYEAADKNFRPLKNRKILSQVKQKYSLPDKFVLYVGDINWNKNIPTLFKACRSLKYPLVIVGAAAVKDTIIHPWTTDIIWLQQQYHHLQKSSPNQLILTGYVSDQDLAALYNLATIYCQPSFAEGFCLPVVQAMQSGTPVIYPKNTAVSEIMDYNGEFFDPYSQKSLISTLAKLWDNPKLRQKYSLMGLKHSKIYQWKFTALQTLAVYHLALNYGQ